MSEKEFLENKFSLEDMFHPLVLEKFRNDTLFKVKETFASYYGICYTIKKLTKERVADYSFQFVLNNSMGNFLIIEYFLIFHGSYYMTFQILDYFYYLHEPNEEQHLYMSVFKDIRIIS